MLGLDELYDRRPSWLSGGPDWTEGGITRSEGRFLLERIASTGATTVVEIGTAAGLSTAVLALGAERVISYDIATRYYADEGRATGEAAREMLAADQVARITFRNPAGALDAREELEEDSLVLAFIDAMHRHPWPALDLLALLPTLAVGAEVALHDVNLPLVAPEWPVWGAKWLFDGLSVPKHVDEGREPPNIGSVTVPADKEAFRREILEIVERHQWEIDPPERVTGALLAA